ncbi:hypothetical protein HG530_007807 [Fusarium avenaceum]|nr:hypothetical protein HG530_007807 [Fusarium avenaceum]
MFIREAPKCDIGNACVESFFNNISVDFGLLGGVVRVYIHLSDGNLEPERLIRVDHFPDDARNQGLEGDVHLQGNSIDGDAFRNELCYQIVEFLALLRLYLDKVLVEEQLGIWVCCSGYAKGVLNVVGTERVVEVRGCQATTIHFKGLRNNVPSIHLAAVSVHDSLKVSSHLGAKSCWAGNVKHIVRGAAGRDKPMSLDNHVVGLCKIDQSVELTPVIVPLGLMKEVPLQLVLRRETVELLRKDGSKLCIIEVGRIDSPRPNENVLLGRLFPQ